MAETIRLNFTFAEAIPAHRASLPQKQWAGDVLRIADSCCDNPAQAALPKCPPASQNLTSLQGCQLNGAYSCLITM